MIIDNHNLRLELKNSVLTLSSLEMGGQVELDFPAVEMSIAGNMVRPDPDSVGAPEVKDNIMEFAFQCGGLGFCIRYILAGNESWLTKRVHITSEQTLPTPDYVQIDRQTRFHDNLTVRGYRPTRYLEESYRDYEEAGGFIAGCGYPAIGDHFFAGIAHPAAFCEASGAIVSLKHYPVWENGSLQVVDGVIGWSGDAEEHFTRYLDTIRLPGLKKPMVAFGNGWAYPRMDLGMDRKVSLDGFKSFIETFQKLGLQADVFTHDCGWYDNHSIFQTKDEMGGDAGLLELNALAERSGSKLSLWITHNGRLGYHHEFLRENNYAVGEGQSAHNSGPNYGVMMDQRFRAAVKKRFVELVDKIGAMHFKVDYDNECATNPDFAAEYPTRDHVRQASINAFFEIAKAMRAVNPDIITRNGWWPSPWWLAQANHVWLANSGDSEYATLPSAHQRESALTHRDSIYYAILIRDKTPMPLDCFDNHEFADSIGNPFTDTPTTWSNVVWLSFMRGSTYQSYMFVPWSLHAWKLPVLRDVMAFCRAYAEEIFTGHGYMFGGCPGHGEIYGFCHPGEKRIWVILRNPQAVPQVFSADFNEYTACPAADVLMFHPHFEKVPTKSAITLLAHEIRMFIVSPKPLAWTRETPCQPGPAPGKSFFPASKEIAETASLDASFTYLKSGQIACLQEDITLEPALAEFRYNIVSPFRMNNLQLQIKLTGVSTDSVEVLARCSRMDAKAKYSAYQLPVTKLRYGTVPGHGEERNPDLLPDNDATYYSAVIPNGGECAILLRLEHFKPKSMDAEMWISGYEDRALAPVEDDCAAGIFSKVIPPQHPYGFGRALRLKTRE